MPSAGIMPSLSEVRAIGVDIFRSESEAGGGGGAGDGVRGTLTTTTDGKGARQPRREGVRRGAALSAERASDSLATCRPLQSQRYVR